MPLHRDIHWIGRQWAVTGHGMQLIDQKLQGFFDIEVSRLWDDILIASVHAKEWLNRADFDKGLALARARYPQSPVTETPSRQAALPPAVAPVTPVVMPIVATSEAPKLEMPKPAPVIPQPVVASPTPAAVAPKPAAIETPGAEVKAPFVSARAPAVTPPPGQVAAPSATQTVAPLPLVVKPPEPKPVAPKLEAPMPAAPTVPKPASIEPPRAELKAPTTAPRAAVAPPTAAPLRQVAPPEPAAPHPPAVKSGEVKRGTLQLGAPEPVHVTVRRRPVEATPAATPRLQVSSTAAMVSGTPPAPPAPRPPAVEPAAPERVVFVKPGVIEKLGAVTEPPAPTVGTRPAVTEPSPPPTLLRMRYEGRARFVRLWRVVARKF